MIVFCNGVFKSGSTWLHAIVQEIFHIKKIKLEEIPQRFWLHKDSPTKIVESQLLSFIESYEDDIKDKFFLTKSHFFQKETHERKYPKDVIFLFITRDTKDAIVSHYHHFNNSNKIKVTFNFYYWTIGRLKAYEIILFQKICTKYHSEEMFLSFENLKNNFEEEVLKIASLIGFKELTEDDLISIKSQTNLINMRNQSKLNISKYYPDKNNLNYKQFRKGLIGESLLYFSDKKIQDIQRIQREEISLCFRIVYYLLFTLRRKFLGIE